MNTLSYKTVSANKATVTKEWVVLDATDQVLGRLAAKAAFMLRGKHKPNFTPHVDCGDNVIIINAEKIRLTGNKMDQKTYVRHSGYPGGQSSETAKELHKRRPLALVEHAVKVCSQKHAWVLSFPQPYVYEGRNTLTRHKNKTNQFKRKLNRAWK